MSKFVTDRQTDRQTNSLTPYTGGCGFFLQVKFATSLLASLAGDKILQEYDSFEFTQNCFFNSSMNAKPILQNYVSGQIN